VLTFCINLGLVRQLRPLRVLRVCALSVRVACARCVCTLRVRVACARCVCALRVCVACARCVCALRVRVAAVANEADECASVVVVIVLITHVFPTCCQCDFRIG